MTSVTLAPGSPADSESIRAVLATYERYQRAQSTRRLLLNKVPMPTLVGWMVTRMTGMLALHTVLMTTAAVSACIAGVWIREILLQLRLTRMLELQAH